MHHFVLSASVNIVSPNSILSGGTTQLKIPNKHFVFTCNCISLFLIKEGVKFISADFGFSSLQKENEIIT